MPQFTIPLALTIKARTEKGATEIVLGAIEHLLETFNDNGSIVRGNISPHTPLTSDVSALIRAAQAACQSQNGTDPQATAAQHARDLAALQTALAKILNPSKD